LHFARLQPANARKKQEEEHPKSRKEKTWNHLTHNHTKIISNNSYAIHQKELSYITQKKYSRERIQHLQKSRKIINKKH